jgi:hypothetical protein
VDAPHPSTTLNAIDSADETICVLSDPRSPRGNDRAARRTPNTSSCVLAHTISRRKSCIPTCSMYPLSLRPHFSSDLPHSSHDPNAGYAHVGTVHYY